MPSFSRSLEQALHRALALAGERRHEYATLEHLLLALIDDLDASAVMKACNVDLGALRKNLANYVDNELGDWRNPTATTPDRPLPFSASFSVP